MSKAIVLHDRFSNEPIVIRASAIKAVRKDFDRTGDAIKAIEDKAESEVK